MLYTALKRKPDLAGIIVTSPGLATGNPVTPSTLRLARFMSKVAPTFTLPNGLDRANLSRDPKVAEVYSADPLVHDRISARLGLELIENGRWMLEHAPDLTLPTLLMQGSADHLVDPLATRRFAETAPAKISHLPLVGRRIPRIAQRDQSRRNHPNHDRLDRGAHTLKSGSAFDRNLQSRHSIEQLF